MTRTHALVIISIRPWLERCRACHGPGGGLRVSKMHMGKLHDKGKLGKFYVYIQW